MAASTTWNEILDESAEIMTALAQPYTTYMAEFLGESAHKVRCHLAPSPATRWLTRTGTPIELAGAREEVAEYVRSLQNLSNQGLEALEEKAVAPDAREIQFGRE